MSKEAGPMITRPLVDVMEVCDVCGYDGGFHMLLERIKDGPPNDVHVRLKCPSCHQVYDVALMVSTIPEEGGS
jgi:hypothetical protein